MRAAVILSGCGYLDGAEIRESVLSLLYLDEQNVRVQCFAPDQAQHHVVNHLTGQEEATPRNVLQESARIARGNVKPLTALNEAVADYDFLVIPGGFGVAKNLSDFAFMGEQATLLSEFAQAIAQFHAAKKPIVAICIAPAVLALALPGAQTKLTIGQDEAIAQIITNSGNQHIICASEESCLDASQKVISCSAYMRDDAGIADIAKGIAKSIAQAVQMVKENGQSAAA